MHKSFWRERIENFGSQYVGHKGHTTQEHTEFYNRKRALIKKHIPEHTKVLDYGCGVGMYADLFDKSKYLGVDIVKLENEFYNDYDFRLIELFEPIPEKVDLILCMNVLQHIRKIEKAISSWNIDKGHILLMENYRESNYYTFNRSVMEYIKAIEKHIDIKEFDYHYFEGFNIFIKIEI